MTKVEINTESKSPPKSGAKLDTLGQPRKGLLSKGCDCDTPLQKRALKKVITKALVIGNGNGLVDVEGSELNKGYWSTYHCSNVMLQDGKKVSSSYCKRRWCLVCNNIRTANLILGYADVLAEFKDPYFVTLTQPSVKAHELEYRIVKSNSSVRKVRDRLKKRGVVLKGIRNHECTYNADKDTFHPHQHFIVEGEEEAHQLKMEWLVTETESEFAAQKVVKADENSVLELFKYMTKVIVKGKEGNPSHYPKAMDVIFCAYKDKRTVQSFGGIKKKEITEEITGNIEHDYLPSRLEWFVYEDQAMDWVSAYGELLSEFSPTKKVIDLVSHLIQKE
jgi:hypothetical protein